MKQKSKIIAIALSFIICLSVFSITAFADEDDLLNNDVNSDVSQVEPDNNQPDDVVPDDNNTPQPDDNNGVSGDDNPNNDYSDNGNLDSDNSGDYNSDGGYTDDNNGYDDYDYSYEDNNSYENYNENDYNNSYDDNSDYGYNSDDYQAPSEVDLYKTDGNVDNPELSDSDWNSIALSLQNAEDADDGDDFNFIKKNNSSSDNGLWMLILGTVLVILSIAGIAYVAITYLNKKRKFAYSGGSDGYNSSSKRVNSRSSYRAKNDYDDGFSSSKSKSKKLITRNRIDDTADIVLPKNKNNRNSRNRYR